MTERNGHAFLDGLPLVEKEITASEVEPEAVILIGNDYRAVVDIDWPFEGPPYIAGIYYTLNEGRIQDGTRLHTA